MYYKKMLGYLNRIKIMRAQKIKLQIENKNFPQTQKEISI